MNKIRNVVFAYTMKIELLTFGVTILNSYTTNPALWILFVIIYALIMDKLYDNFVGKIKNVIQ